MGDWEGSGVNQRGKQKGEKFGIFFGKFFLLIFLIDLSKQYKKIVVWYRWIFFH